MTNRIGLICAFFLAGSIAALNVLWIFLDQQPHPLVDPNLEKIYNLARGYFEKDLAEYPRAWFWASIGPRTPLYQVLGSFSVLLFGLSPDSVLVINSLAIIVAGYFTYRIGQKVMPSLWSLLAVFLLLTMPISVELARLVKPHALTPACLAAVMWYSLQCLEHTRVKDAWLLIAAVLIAFSVHPVTLYTMLPVLISVPLLIVSNLIDDSTNVVTAIKRFFRLPIIIKGFVPACSLAGILMVTWVFIKWDQYVGLRQVLDTIFVGMSGPWRLQARMPETLNWTNTVSLVGAVIVFLVAASGSLIKNTRLPNLDRTSSLLIVWLILMFASIHILYQSMFWQNFAGSLPLIALVIAKGLHLSTHLFAQRIHKTILVLIVVGALQSYLAGAWGLAAIKGLPCGTMNRYCDTNMGLRSNSPMTKPWHIERLLKPIFNSRVDSATHVSVSLLSHRPEYFSDEMLTHNMVRFFDQPSRAPSENFYIQRNTTFLRTGLGKNGFEDWLSADYIIYLDQQKKISDQSDYRRSAQEAYAIDRITKDMASAAPALRLLKRIDLPNGEQAVLLERVGEFNNLNVIRTELSNLF